VLSNIILKGCGLMHKFDIKNLEKLDNPKRRQNMPPIETLKKFKFEGDGTLLDVGCGTGYFTMAAASILEDGKIIGIDIMDEMLEVAKDRSQGVENIEYRKSEEYSFPIEDKSVKYVFISNVIHEVENKIKYLTEIKRVIKSNGYLCIIEWDKKPMEMGPPLEERISIEEIKVLTSSLDMIFVEEININSEHYGAKFKIV
jgi:ubiquinone/menaquinone biosynthesis C-methylase UbiE